MNYDALPWVILPDGTRKIHEELYDVINIVKNYLPSNPVILEAGASTGEDTLRFKETWPQSIIYCFEPNRELYLKLHDRFTNNKSVFVLDYALSDKIGKVKFNQSYAAENSSLFEDNFMNIDFPQEVLDSVHQTKEQMHGYNDVPIETFCATINDWSIRFSVDKIDYMWLDAEGAELNILKGASKLLDKVKVISAELNFREFRKGIVMFDDLYKFLADNNFELKHIWGRTCWQGTGIFVNKGE